MPAAALHRARYALLTLCLPASQEVVAGVLLEDPATNQALVRLRRDWDTVAPEESDVLSELESDLAVKAQESGASALFDYLESTLSNVLPITARRDVAVEDFDRALGRLYREHVASNVREFVTHLPSYSLAVAAGPFLENAEVEAQGWEETPVNLRLTPDMFVA